MLTRGVPVEALLRGRREQYRVAREERGFEEEIDGYLLGEAFWKVGEGSCAAHAGRCRDTLPSRRSGGVVQICTLGRCANGS